MADTVGLTMGELDRLQIVTRIAERRLTRRRAAELLGLSERQVRRLSQAFVYSEISAESSSATAQRDDRVTVACRCARWC